MAAQQGLSSSEVQERRKRGQGNNLRLKTSRSYVDIFKSNFLNPVNVLLYLIGLGMILVSDLASALATVGLAVFNASVGVFQETRAKRQLDKIALLAQAKVVVLRDGQEQAVAPGELVLGDILLLRTGDQAPVDGQLLEGGRIELDESQLTGETDPVTRTAGDEVFSGSVCLSGAARVEVRKVGGDSFANRLASQARQFQLARTPLQRQVNLVMRLLMLVVIFYGLMAILSLFVIDVSLETWLNVAAVIVGLVPIGLLTVIILNYSLGAVRISERGGLVQQINAVESLSNVTVLCSDKTGTLTANRIRFNDVFPQGLQKADLQYLLGAFAASASERNKTTQAIVDGLGGAARPVLEEAPFISARKWSALAFDDPAGAGRPALKGVYVLGALEMLQDRLQVDPRTRQQLQAWSEQGLRVLAFARNRQATRLLDAAGQPELPELDLLGLASFSDELRPHLKETLEALNRNSIRLKIISGDNPQTVAALARQAGLPPDLKLVSGPQLAGLGQLEFEAAAQEADIFGRISPQQKEALVEALRQRGEYVAMMGDGVNDVLSLKKADMGIAMQSGSSATRAVADMVLLNDSFEALPLAFHEGQRIVSSMHNILKIFLPTVLALALMITATTSLGLGFPLNVMQNTLVSFLARGLPPIALAYWARPRQVRRSVYRGLLHFSVPASASIFLFGLLIYMAVYGLAYRSLVPLNVTPAMVAGFTRYLGQGYDVSTSAAFQRTVSMLSAQTALTVFYILAGALLMCFVEPFWGWFAVDGSRSPEWRPTALAAGLMLVGLGIALLPPLARTFQLLPLPWFIYAGVILATLLWLAVMRWSLIHRWTERFLELEP